MNKKIDLTLFNQIKEKFSVPKGSIGIIRLSSENVEDLTIESFFEEDIEVYLKIMRDHFNNDKPYAVLDYLEEDLILYYRCKEFIREEYVATGRVERFRLNPYEKLDFNSDAIKKEFALLAKMLSGDSEAF